MEVIILYSSVSENTTYPVNLDWENYSSHDLVPSRGVVLSSMCGVESLPN